VLAAYRKRALQLHPDQGGFAPRFIQLVAEREHALALAD
jgi:curved DNA-binding protein CbpA